MSACDNYTIIYSIYPWQVCAQIGGAGYQFPVVALAQQAPYGGPHDFIVPALVIAIICGFLNILSVAFGISGIIFAVLVS